MTLQEALNAGRAVRRVGSTGNFTTLNGPFSLEDVLADYELVPEQPLTFTQTQLAAAWDASIPASGSVSAAAQSAMFRRLIQNLGY